MLRKLLICGLAAGVCGGVLATGFASLVGEPAVDRSIAYEHARITRAAERAGVQRELVMPAPISRSVQKSVGLLTAALVYGLALGGVFALVFAVAYGRVARAAPRATAHALAAAAFVVIFLVPFIKYPASPPGTTNPATIGRRTLLRSLGCDQTGPATRHLRDRLPRRLLRRRSERSGALLLRGRRSRR